MAAADVSGRSAEVHGLSAGYWRGRRILITGHSGFIGSWLSVALLQLGAQVHGFAADADDSTRRRSAALAGLGVCGTAGDIRDFDGVRRAMSAASFDVVFHLAAQPLVSTGLDDPRATLDINVGGSINVLEATRLCGPAVLVHVTSDKCYRNRAWLWPYREVDELGAGCPYSTSKAAAELIFQTYAGLLVAVRATSVRFGNVIGGGDFADGRLVPDVLAALRAREPIRLHRPGAVRPWQHVADVVVGLLLMAAALENGSIPSGDVFNFAPPGEGATVEALVTALVRAWCAASGRTVPVLVDSAERYPEEELLRLDGRKAAGALGWTHRLDLDGSAAAIIDWDRAVSEGLPPMEATARQVSNALTTAGTSRLAQEEGGRA